MQKEINLLDVVALLKPMPQARLLKGQVGTVVEVLDKDVFEVEFCDRHGRTIAMLPVSRVDLLLLQYELEMA